MIVVGDCSIARENGVFAQKSADQELTIKTFAKGIIIAGKDSSGNVLVIHCASGANNVVITGKSGFGYADIGRAWPAL